MYVWVTSLQLRFNVVGCIDGKRGGSLESILEHVQFYQSAEEIVGEEKGRLSLYSIKGDLTISASSF